ncbi:MAG: 30S ribosomal protein S17 [bacterium]|nr:30S ribosomal protein S17 [bacterium]
MKVTTKKKRQIGTVLRRKTRKTAVVQIARLIRHPLFEKRIIRTKKIYAHDEHETVQPGDTVLLQETRPISKLKRWRVVKVLRRSTVEGEI